MDYFQKSMGDPKRPLAAIIGGAKVSSKLGALRNMMDRVDIMIIGGAMANTFLKSQGLQMGTSLVEDDLLDTATELLARAKDKGVKLYLPVDGVVADRLDGDATTETVVIQDLPEDRMMLDIGPATIRLFGKVLQDVATIVWNGPMGAFETVSFAAGTLDLLRQVASSAALTIIGGGDTVLAVHTAGVAEDISYISTGGGAFLMLMEGKELPGVAALEK
jgi:phosphoglycerate kinase